ncbi:MAG: biopolymer transporter ExbD [Kiritimatiellae bacterium]|nr:biopolymer transporter ExbD [Kiritimatiellia bacterium]
MAKKPNNEDVSLDMTPMIDVVFQLIIFFVVTLKMSDDKDTTIKLEDGKAGIPLTQEELPPSQLTIDVARNGRVSLSNITLSDQMLAQKIQERKARYGTEFPCMIRADWRTKHRDIARVMNICTANGVWKLSFVAIKEAKGSMSARGKKK